MYGNTSNCKMYTHACVQQRSKPEQLMQHLNFEMLTIFCMDKCQWLLAMCYTPATSEVSIRIHTFHMVDSWYDHILFASVATFKLIIIVDVGQKRDSLYYPYARNVCIRSLCSRFKHHSDFLPRPVTCSATFSFLYTLYVPILETSL